MPKSNNPKIIKSSYFGNWADLFGYPAASLLLPLVVKFKFITPNAVTIFSFGLYTAGSISLFLNYPNHLYLAAIGILLGYIGDDLDGQLARARGLSSNFGDYLDKVLDVLKIFIITFSLSLAVSIQKNDFSWLALGFISCFFFMFRYYIKLETIFSRINNDPSYLVKSTKIREQLEAKIAKFSFIKSIWFRNRIIFFVDEAEIAIFTALAALLNRLELALIVLALSQPLIAFFRFFERGNQIKKNPSKLLRPMRK